MTCRRRGCSFSSVALDSIYLLLFESLVVARAAQINVIFGQLWLVVRGQRQPLFTVLFAQAQDTQAGTETVLRIDSAFEDVGILQSARPDIGN